MTDDEETRTSSRRRTVEMRTTTGKWERGLQHNPHRCGGGMRACMKDEKSSGGDGSLGDLVLINNAQFKDRVNS